MQLIDAIFIVSVLLNLSDSVVCIPFIHVGRVQRIYKAYSRNGDIQGRKANSK